MIIVYVAAHDKPNSNDDEGAITHALRTLGHEVRVIREDRNERSHLLTGGADFLLFHKWRPTLGYFERLNIPKVFWFFDLVDFPDPTLRIRNYRRLQWMGDMIQRVDLGFCTDGDWVARTNKATVEAGRPEKLVWLTQGADSRRIGRGDAPERCPMCRHEWPGPDLLFFGRDTDCGLGRASFVREMKEKYGDRFLHLNGPTERWGRDLANLIASTKIVLAPDVPVTDRYWSNRVYLTTGFGGFLMHPFSEGLAGHYVSGSEVVYYYTREYLHDQIEYWLAHPEERHDLAVNGMNRTLKEHTYTRRCQTLVETVKQRLGI